MGPRQPHVHRHDAGLGRETGRHSTNTTARIVGDSLGGPQRVERLAACAARRRAARPSRIATRPRCVIAAYQTPASTHRRSQPVLGEHQHQRGQRHQFPAGAGTSSRSPPPEPAASPPRTAATTPAPPGRPGSCVVRVADAVQPATTARHQPIDRQEHAAQRVHGDHSCQRQQMGHRAETARPVSAATPATHPRAP